MPSWFILSVSSVFILAFAELSSQKVLTLGKNFTENTSSTISMFFQALLALPVIIFLGLQNQFFVPASKNLLPFLLVDGALSVVAIYFYLKSFKVKNISISAILLSFSAVVTTILGVVFLDEPLSIQKVLGIGLILSAITVLNVKNIHLEKNHLYGLLSGIFFALSYVLDKYVVINSNPFVYSFWIYATVVAINFILNPAGNIRLIKNIKLNQLKVVLMVAFGYLFYNFLTYSAYSKGGDVGSVDAINNTQVYLIILYEYFVLKDRKGIKRKVLTAGLAVCGVILLGLT